MSVSNLATVEMVEAVKNDQSNKRYVHIFNIDGNLSASSLGHPIPSGTDRYYNIWGMFISYSDTPATDVPSLAALIKTAVTGPDNSIPVSGMSENPSPGSGAFATTIIRLSVASVMDGEETHGMVVTGFSSTSTAAENTDVYVDESTATVQDKVTAL